MFTTPLPFRPIHHSELRSQWLPRWALGGLLAAALGVATPAVLSAGEGYLSRVGPPPLRLNSPGAQPSNPQPNPRAQNAAAPSKPESAAPAATTANPGEKPIPAKPAAAEEPLPPEPYGPPPPPAGDTAATPPENAAKPAAKPDQAPPTEQPEPAKQNPTPIVEFRAASEPVGIRSFDPSGRVAITPQMLVRFFKRRPNDPLSATPTENSGALEAMPEILVPVEFVPPQPMTTLPSSTATYQLVPKP
ncbi:MAG: hypothetical protein JNN07_22130 [Verrucomicrobiales bacterium]|nr:hypothetical protein [Verrucomicrobiales bacterium]